ncbi:MAG TPA: hypothetical protein VM580_35340 [Labilithrix sp.]|jgi:hypothetical protein|nr:hypothetical protein [Labilithrix sp.]
MRYRRKLTTLAMCTLTALASAMGICGEAQAEESAAPPAASSAAPAEVDPRTRFAGTFRYAGDAREDVARKAAIDRAIESLFFMIRPMARSKLGSGCQIFSWYAFSFEPGKIRVRAPDRPDSVSPDNGAPANFVFNGDKSKLTQRFVGGRLSQTYAAEEGARHNEYSLSPDGKTMTLKVTITSPKLSHPLVYSLTYKKVS